MPSCTLGAATVTESAVIADLLVILASAASENRIRIEESESNRGTPYLPISRCGVFRAGRLAFVQACPVAICDSDAFRAWPRNRHCPVADPCSKVPRVPASRDPCHPPHALEAPIDAAAGDAVWAAGESRTAPGKPGPMPPAATWRCWRQSRGRPGGMETEKRPNLLTSLPATARTLQHPQRNPPS